MVNQVKTAPSIVESDQQKIDELERLQEFAQSTTELKYVLTKDWIIRIQEVIRNLGSERNFSDGGYNLYRILGSTLNDLSPEELEERLCIVSKAAEDQGKLRTYRKTRSELKSQQDNQILAAVFEIIILSKLFQYDSTTILYPRIVPDSHKDVEALFSPYGREVFLEAKALGYSNYDPKGSVGSQSVASLKKQVRDALSDKLEKDSHLSLLADEHPTVLCLALGFNADQVSAEWAIRDFFSEELSNVSMIIVFGSAFCRKDIFFFSNPSSSIQLSKYEESYLKKALSPRGM